jgi:hypothetical protein
MSTKVRQQSSHILSLSGAERDSLLGLLRQALGEARTEVRRTHTPGFRESVLAQHALLRALIEKLERLAPDQTETAPGNPDGIEEESPATDLLYVDEQGRFQMTTEELGDFLRFLRDNEVLAEVETAHAFRSGTKAYGYGQILHLYDIDSVKHLYRTWKQQRASRTPGEKAPTRASDPDEKRGIV